MITVTIRVKLILKAFGYTIVILAGAFIVAMIVWIVTSNQDLTTCTYTGSLFLGILAVLTSELQKRETLVLQQLQRKQEVAIPSHTPVVAEYGLGTHQVRTATILDLNLGIFDLHVGVRTDVERSKCVRSQHVPTHTPINQITQD